MEKTKVNKKEDVAQTSYFEDIERLIKLIDTLRGENGCPWDRKQTPKTMSVYLVEEVYELVEAIRSGSFEDICEELGDVLFHIFFIASIFRDQGSFDIGEAVKKITEKMIRRHPHVFGDTMAETVEDVKKQWRKIKKQEKPGEKQSSVLDSVPGALPALIRAYRISERAAGAGFDWDDLAGVLEKSEEEWAEFLYEIKAGEKEKAAMEFGDVLFTLVNVARIAKIHPETALSDSIEKFEKRFRCMEASLAEKGQTTDSIPRPGLENLWNEVKR